QDVAVAADDHAGPETPLTEGARHDPLLTASARRRVVVALIAEETAEEVVAVELRRLDRRLAFDTDRHDGGSDVLDDVRVRIASAGECSGVPGDRCGLLNVRGGISRR